MLPYSIFSFTIHGKNKISHKNNKSEISAPKLNVKFKLSDGSYSVSSMKVYFEYIIKKHN